jgi:hypothetical protein
MHRSILAAAFAAIAAGAVAPAAAQSIPDAEFTITPYIWIAWPEGDIETEFGDGSVTPPEINANFDDVSLSGIFTGSADARFGRFGVFGDLSYYEIEAEKNINIVGDVFVDGTLNVGGVKAMLNGYWRAYDSGHAHVDLLAGIHYLEANLEANLVTPNRTINGEIDDDWFDPVIGARGVAEFSEHFGVEGFAFYGGFGVNSDELYDLFAAAHIRFNDLFTASLGWRHFTDKFSGDLVDYEVSFSGPLLGLEFSF